MVALLFSSILITSVVFYTVISISKIENVGINTNRQSINKNTPVY